jgi:hypothetical protein
MPGAHQGCYTPMIAGQAVPACSWGGGGGHGKGGGCGKGGPCRCTRWDARILWVPARQQRVLEPEPHNRCRSCDCCFCMGCCIADGAATSRPAIVPFGRGQHQGPAVPPAGQPGRGAAGLASWRCAAQRSLATGSRQLQWFVRLRSFPPGSQSRESLPPAETVALTRTPARAHAHAQRCRWPGLWSSTPAWLQLAPTLPAPAAGLRCAPPKHAASGSRQPAAQPGRARQGAPCAWAAGSSQDSPVVGKSLGATPSELGHGSVYEGFHHRGRHGAAARGGGGQRRRRMGGDVPGGAPSARRPTPALGAPALHVIVWAGLHAASRGRALKTQWRLRSLDKPSQAERANQQLSRGNENVLGRGIFASGPANATQTRCSCPVASQHRRIKRKKAASQL